MLKLKLKILIMKIKILLNLYNITILVFNEVLWAGELWYSWNRTIVHVLSSTRDLLQLPIINFI